MKFYIVLLLACASTLAVAEACNTLCFDVEFPFCAQNPITGQYKDFGNTCFLGVYNCENPDDVFNAVTLDGTTCEAAGLIKTFGPGPVQLPTNV